MWRRIVRLLEVQHVNKGEESVEISSACHVCQTRAHSMAPVHVDGCVQIRHDTGSEAMGFLFIQQNFTTTKTYKGSKWEKTAAKLKRTSHENTKTLELIRRSEIKYVSCKLTSETCSSGIN